MDPQVRQEVSVAEAKITEALDALQHELKPLENVVRAFRHVFLENARLKEEISTPRSVQPPQVDASRFERGVSLLTAAGFIDFDPGLWELSIHRMMPALERGFPKLGSELSSIKEVMAGGRLDGQRLLKMVVDGRQEEAEALAADVGIDLRSAGFVLGQIARPLVEITAQGLSPMVQGLHWSKGYCPLCGSMPELAYLKGEEGQRWLRCSFCSHEWRFSRLVCPFCETDKHDQFLVYYIAGRELERVEACTHCRRYVLTIDLRGRAEEPVLEVAAVGLVHLDVLAQQKGFLPAAWSAWNLISSEDISSAPVGIAPRETPM